MSLQTTREGSRGQTFSLDFAKPFLSISWLLQKNGTWLPCKQYVDLKHQPETSLTSQQRMTRQNAPDSSEYSRLRDAIAAFPPRPVADFLLTVFIRHATDLFFYIDQDQFLIEIDHFYKTPSSSLRSDAGFVCLALAIFALGSQWTPMERPEGSQQQEKGADLGRIFFRQAKTLIPDIIDRPCLRSIQAPFVLGVYLMPANAIGSSYVYMGLALRKALAFDLHLHSEDQNMSAREKEVRRRLWWSLYSLERLVVAMLNIDTRLFLMAMVDARLSS